MAAINATVEGEAPAMTVPETMPTVPITATPTAGCPRLRSGHFGAWRALAAFPAVAGSVLFMLVLTAGLGRWQTLGFGLWLGAPGLLNTRVGERWAVRTRGFRPLPAGQGQALAPVCGAAMVRCGVRPDEVDFYLKAGGQPNACVTGRRSLAVTEGALKAFVTGRLSHDQLGAIVCHELGHIAQGATAGALAIGWLAAPGRLAFRLVLTVAYALSGCRRLRWGNRLLLGVGGGIALQQALQHSHGIAVLMLAGLAIALLGTPVLDAAISRAAERAADRYAAAVGAGPDLAQALLRISNADPQKRWIGRLLDSHPSVASRVKLLGTGAGMSPGER